MARAMSLPSLTTIHPSSPYSPASTSPALKPTATATPPPPHPCVIGTATPPSLPPSYLHQHLGQRLLLRRRPRRRLPLWLHPQGPPQWHPSVSWRFQPQSRAFESRGQQPDQHPQDHVHEDYFQCR
jgi:hypothetical protein